MAATTASDGIPWKDERFPGAVDKVRAACGVVHRDDDAMIGMMLDRFSWDEKKVVEMYKKSVERREKLGLNSIREHIQTNDLKLHQFPHAEDINKVIPIFASSSLDRPVPPSESETVQINGRAVEAGDVMGCYEMRYGQGSTSVTESTVTPQEFTKYMLYVTQWRWLQCEAYTRRHGVLGFWSMVHDLSCPQGFFTLWGSARSLFSKYMTPTQDACANLFPPMVQKILIINVPSLFGPVWSLVSPMVPAHLRERIVLLTASNTTVEEVTKFVSPQHMPPHIAADQPAPSARTSSSWW